MQTHLVTVLIPNLVIIHLGVW